MKYHEIVEKRNLMDIKNVIEMVHEGNDIYTLNLFYEGEDGVMVVIDLEDKIAQELELFLIKKGEEL